MPDQNDNKPMTAQEAAEFLRVSKTTMIKLLNEGRIKAVKVGRAWRIKRANLEAYLEGNTAEKND